MPVPDPVPALADPAVRGEPPSPGALHQAIEAAPPIRPAVARARRLPILPRIIERAREWQRTAAMLIMAAVALAGVSALVVAGRSYYARITTPGTVVVASTPRGSEVIVDGEARGVTPLTLSLPPGDHVLELRRNGLTRRFPISLAPGAELSQELNWANVRVTGTLVVNSVPPGATVTVDGREHGVTPLTITDLAVGLRRVVLDSSAGTVRRDVRVVADTEVKIDERIVSGWVAAFAPFELQIFEGSRRLGTTDDGRIMVPPGPHELDFVNTRLGYRERRIVEVTPGTTTAVNITSVVGAVQVTAPAGTEVLIDGASVGVMPLDEFRVPLGTHEVVLRHPQLGERKLSIAVGASEPTEVNADFGP
jgi:hypothetical protein